MKLSEELAWRGFVNQTTFKDITVLDEAPLTFYWGVDPSADSMQVGNLAIAMMVRHFIAAGHKPILLVGGATGLIGDPDGKSQERDLQSLEAVANNKAGITKQYRQIFDGLDFTLVDNYDWFKHMNYLTFLRDVGKHVPMRAMLSREFVASRLGEEGAGISYAEFSYSLIQGYDFLHLHREYSVSLQVCGADQWGNSIAGVDLIRRVTGHEAHIWSAPLVINKTTGVKFGKSESGTVWLDPAKTSPTTFYQFWMNVDDAGVADYLKIYTLFSESEITALLAAHANNPKARTAQQQLAAAVTALVHGQAAADAAAAITEFLTGARPIGDIVPEVLATLQQEIPVVTTTGQATVVDCLVRSGLASSATEARRLLAGNAVSVNGHKVTEDTLPASLFTQGRLLLRRGKAYKDSALIVQG